MLVPARSAVPSLLRCKQSSPAALAMNKAIKVYLNNPFSTHTNTKPPSPTVTW